MKNKFVFMVIVAVLLYSLINTSGIVSGAVSGVAPIGTGGGASKTNIDEPTIKPAIGIRNTNVSIREIYSNESLESNSFEVNLVSGHFLSNPVPKNVALQTIVSKTDNVYYLVQFDNNSVLRRDYPLLKNDNITVVEYIPDNTYIVKIPQNAFSRTFNSIRWIDVLKPEQKVHSKLKEFANSHLNDTVEIAISFFEPLNEEQIIPIKQLSEKIIDFGAPFDSIIVEIESNKIKQVSNMNFVKFIDIYERNKLFLDKSSRVIAANDVWDWTNASSVTVGVIDSGIQFNHQHFSGIVIYNSTDYVDDDSIPQDTGCGHGVRVAGVVSGSGTYQQRTIRGISSKANLVIERKFNSSCDEVVPPSTGTNEPWNKILDPDGDGNYTEPSSADVIDASWGHGDGEYDSVSERVDEIANGQLSNGKKVLVVVAAGNDGPNSRSDSPGTAKNALTIGASAATAGAKEKAEEKS